MLKGSGGSSWMAHSGHVIICIDFMPGDIHNYILIIEHMDYLNNKYWYFKLTTVFKSREVEHLLKCRETLEQY